MAADKYFTYDKRFATQLISDIIWPNVAEFSLEIWLCRHQRKNWPPPQKKKKKIAWWRHDTDTFPCYCSFATIVIDEFPKGSVIWLVDGHFVISMRTLMDKEWKHHHHHHHVHHHHHHHSLYMINSEPTSTNTTLPIVELEITIEALVFVTLVLVVTEVSLLAGAHVAAITAVLHYIHTRFAPQLHVRTLARVRTLAVGGLKQRKGFLRLSC